MTKAAALYQFFNSVIPGVTAYVSTSVPSKANGDNKDAAFPYLTYDPVFSAFGAGEVSISVNLWFHGDSEAPANAAVQTLSDALGQGGTQISCDGGSIWLKRGTPFAQAIQEEDQNLKRRYVNIDAEFFTAD